jgi:hypothetical protein
MVVDGELLTLEGGDIVRVSPAAKRALKAAEIQIYLLYVLED